MRAMAGNGGEVGKIELGVAQCFAKEELGLLLYGLLYEGGVGKIDKSGVRQTWGVWY